MDLSEREEYKRKREMLERWKEKDPLLVTDINRLDDLRNYLINRYQWGTKDICRAYRASRAWADKRLRQNLHHVYVSRDWGYATRVFSYSGPERNDGIWGNRYDTTELDEIVRGTIAKRRSCAIWVQSCLRDVEAKRRYEELVEALDVAVKPGNEKLRMKWLKVVREREDSFEEAKPDLVWESLSEAVAIGNDWKHRAKYGWWEIGDRHPGLSDTPFKDLLESRPETASSMRDYGDSSEEVERHIWKECMVRLEVPMPGGGVRVMYRDDRYSKPELGSNEWYGYTIVPVAPLPPDIRGRIAARTSWESL